MKIYVIGSLRNPRIPEIGNVLRDNGFDVFDDWFAGGYEADDKWQEYEHKRGRSYREALRGENARHIYEFDLSHLDTSDAGVLVMPAGRSAHLELGYLRGQGKKTYVLFDKEPDRFDVMYRFADDVFFSTEEMLVELNREMGQKVFETGGAYKSVVSRS